LDLSRDLKNGLGIVDNVLLCGLPKTFDDSLEDWVRARLVVSGRLVHGYSCNDWVLKFLFRGSAFATKNIAGLSPVPDINGVENVNLSDLITGHLDYAGKMPQIMEMLNFP